jgi:hypothetical protein
MLSEAKLSYQKETEARASLEVERSKLMSANANLQTEMENTRKAEEERVTLEAQLRRARQLESIGMMAGGAIYTI